MRLHLDQGSRGPDDRILASCLLLATEATAVTLLTDDINLANKARANDLRVASSKDVRTELSGGIVAYKEPSKDVGGHKDKGQSTRTQGPTKVNSLKESEVVRGAVRNLLEVVLIREFKEAYGEPLWRQVVAVAPQPAPPHWDLETLFRLYKKHHIAVFSLAFPSNGRELEESLDRLQKCFKTNDQDLLATALRVAEVLGAKPTHQDVVQSTKGVLNQRETGDKPGAPVADLFNLAWQQIATCASNYARAFNVQCSLPEVQSDVGSLRPPFDQVASLLSSVTGLQEALVSSASDQSEGNLQRLQVRLVELSLGLERPAPSLGVRDLSCWVKDNPELVGQGLRQIEGVRNILAVCLANQ